jgi:hypothetical protein
VIRTYVTVKNFLVYVQILIIALIVLLAGVSPSFANDNLGSFLSLSSDYVKFLEYRIYSRGFKFKIKRNIWELNDTQGVFCTKEDIIKQTVEKIGCVIFKWESVKHEPGKITVELKSEAVTDICKYLQSPIYVAKLMRKHGAALTGGTSSLARINMFNRLEIKTINRKFGCTTIQFKRVD